MPIHFKAHILFGLFLAFMSTFAVTGCFAADKPDDAKSIEGLWLPVKGELGGKAMSGAVLKTITLKMKAGQYDVMAESLDQGTYKIDSAAEPKAITVTGLKGPNAGKTFPAIYELKGDTLRICYDLSGAKRPTEFKSSAGTMLYLVTYNRGK